MMTIERKLVRDLLKKPWRLLGVCLTIAGGTGIYGAIDMALESGPYTLDTFYSKTAFADLEVMILPEDADNLPDFSGIAGLQSVEKRLVLPGTVYKKDSSYLTGLLTLTHATDPGINKLALTSGVSHGGHPDWVVMDRGLAEFHGYVVGDRITLKVGEKTFHDTIVGNAISPEYFASASNPDYTLPEKGNLGVLFGSLSRMQQALGFSPVNDLIFKFAPEADPDKIKASIMKALGGASIERITDRNTHFSNQNIMVRVANYRIFTSAIVFTLLALAVIVSLITFNRLVLEQRMELGTLVAMGYSRRSLVASYARVAVGLGLAAGLVGWFIACFVRNLFTLSFMQANGLPFIDNYFDFRTLGIGMAGSVLIAEATVLLPLLMFLRNPPMEMIRVQYAHQNFSRGLLFRLFAWMDTLTIPYRFGMRNLLRRPWMTLVGALTMGFALGVPISYALSLTSNVMTMIKSFDQEKWDLAVDFLHPIYNDEMDGMRKAGGVRSASPYFRRFGEIGDGSRFLDTKILGITAGDPIRPVDVVEGKGLSGAEDEVIVSRDLAKDLGLFSGGKADIRVSGVLHPMKIVGITSDIFTRQIVLPLETAQRVCQFEGKVTGAYLKGESIDVAGLLAMENVGRVSNKAQMLTELKARWKESMSVVYITTVFSLMMALIYVFMTINLNIAERKGDYATLLCLGYDRPQTLKIISTESGGLLALAIALSLPMSVLLALYFNGKMSEAWFENHFHYNFSDFVLPLVSVVVLIPWVVYISSKNIFRFDIGSELRYRNIG